MKQGISHKLKKYIYGNLGWLEFRNQFVLEMQPEDKSEAVVRFESLYVF